MMNNPKVKEIWYIQHKTVSTLAKVEIVELTKKTVTIQTPNKLFPEPRTYKRGDIEFVERIE